MIENKDKWAREIAAQCWCDKETENKTMDVALAMAVAKRIAFAYEEGRKAERERCAMIAEDEAIEHNDGEESYLCGAGELIAKKIRGGQDGN